MFDGFILRKPRIASSASPFTAAPDVVVLPSDRSQYLTNYVDVEDPPSEEFLVVPASTSNLIVAEEEQVEILNTAIDGEGTLFQFNEQGRAVRDVTVDPIPDHLNVDAGIIRYDSAPGSAVEVTYYFDPISIWYTKNGETTRFGFDNARDRWRPLPGSSPDALGTMPESGLVELETVEFPRDHRIMLGHPSAGQEIILEGTDWEDEFDESLEPDPDEVVAFLDTGEVWFGSDFVDDHFGGPLFQFRQDFYEFDDSTGQIGEVGDELFLNPLPEQGNRPLIRVEYGTHLPVKTGTSSGDIDADYPVVWDEDTGQVFVDEGLFREGQAVYYDGVYVTDEPIYSPEPDSSEIATISGVNFLQTEVEFTTDIDPESMILFLPETGLCFEEVQVVDDQDDFLRSFELPDQKAQVHVDGSTMTVRLPHSFASQYAGEDLAVTTGDFPLENGITFRMFRSPVNLTGERDIPDVTDRVRVVDEEVIDSVRPGTFASLVQVPLQNIGGYGENLFFRLQDGPRRQFLEPEKDVVYDFDNDRLLWTEQAQTEKTITSTRSSISLDHEVLYDNNFTFELNEGEGFEELEPTEDVLVDFDTGELSFSDLRGGTLYEGMGRISDANSSEFEFRTVELNEDDFDFPIDDDRLLPLLIFEEREEVYRIVAVDEVSNILTVHKDFGFEQGAVSFKVIEPPEVVFEYSLRSLTLNRRWVFPKKISSIDDGEFVPDGESFSFRDEGDGTTLDHEVLRPATLGTLDDHDDDPLELPVYYQEAGSNFTIFRESRELVGPVSNPGPNEFDLNNGVFEFNQDDIETNPDAAIVLDPQLSDSNHGHANPIEVLHENRQVGFHGDLDGSDVLVAVQLRQEQYTVQPRNGVIFFNSTFRSGDRLEVDYFTDEDTEVTETLGFKTTETLDVDAGDSSAVFASDATVHPDRPVQVLVNGAPVDGSFSIDEDGIASVFFGPVSANRMVQVQYQQLEAEGGERISQLSARPFFPPVELKAGSDQQFYGNHLDVLAEDTVLQFDDEAYVVQSVSYDVATDTTEVELYPPVREERTTDSVLGTTKPVRKKDSVPFKVDDNSEDEQAITVSGDVSSNVDPFDVLFLDDAPHFVSGVSFEEEDGVTVIQFRNVLLREYDSPVVQVSEELVYSPDTETLLTESLAFAETQPHRLIRFDEQDNGHLLDAESQYEFLDAGSIILDPTNTSLPSPGERWFMAYLARREVGPRRFKGRRIVPQFRSQYTRFVNASTDNGIEGSALVATYSYSSPDTFYFRALELDEFRGEVQDNLASGAEGMSAGSGSTASFGGAQELHERGEDTLIWTEGHLYDQDRVARRFIEFYNTIAQLMEAYLQTLDGRVIGDRDGQFKFFVEDADDQPDPGQTDPVTGRMEPYYANPENPGTRPTRSEIADMDRDKQENFIHNSIDDVILTSRKPLEIEISFPGFEIFFEGTFRQAWEPHRLSRFYPQRSNVALVTPPDSEGDEEYDFTDDFWQLLGDLDKEDIIAVNNVQDRPARAWVNSDEVEMTGDGLKIPVGMEFELGDTKARNPEDVSNAEQGSPTKLIPGFSKGDIVHLGRVTYENSSEMPERSVNTYGHNLVVTDVGEDHVTVDEAGLTDILDLVFGDGHDEDEDDYDAPEFSSLDDVSDDIQKHDTLFGQSTEFFLSGRDFQVDSSEGEMINFTLPSPFRQIIGQNHPEPETFLEAEVVYKNQRTEPFRFPALDGEPVDDDGLTGMPYSNPIPDSESLIGGTEEDLMNRLQVRTVSGLNAMPNDVVNGLAYEFGFDLDDVSDNPAFVEPRRYDEVFFEDVVDGSDESIGFSVSEVDGDTLYVATFDAEEQDIPYQIEQAFDGDGERDPVDDHQWNDDDGMDFSNLDALGGTLHIDGSTYNIDEFGDGYIVVTSGIGADDGPIDEEDGEYHFDIEGVGDVQEDIRTFEDDTIVSFDILGPDDHSYEGSILKLDGVINDEEYEVVRAEDNRIFSWPVGLEDADIESNNLLPMAVKNNPILVEGSGDSTDNVWNDGSVDFTNLDQTGIGPLYLHVLSRDSTTDRVLNASRYSIVELHDGHVVVDEEITEDSGDYVVTISRSFGQGHAVVDLSDPDQLQLESGVDPANLNVEEGHTLVIPSGLDTGFGNGGRYTVDAIGDEHIEVSPDLRVDTTGSPDDYVEWYSYRPRRQDSLLERLAETFLDRWVLYQDPEDAPEPDDPDNPERVGIKDPLSGREAKNPSTPSLDLLDELVGVVFGDPVAGGVAEVFENGGDWFLEDPSVDFETMYLDDSEPNLFKEEDDGGFSFVAIDADASQEVTSEARGFYRIVDIEDSKLELSDGEETFYFDETAAWIDRIGADPNVEYQVYTAVQFSNRTYELILYEYYNVLTILQRLHSGYEGAIHDPSNFTTVHDAIFGEHPGDMTNVTLQNHLNGKGVNVPVGVTDRRDWIGGYEMGGDVRPSVVNEINAILKGREALYDLRFSWIDFRVNFEEGTLPSIRRFEDQREKEKRKIRKDMLKIL